MPRLSVNEELCTDCRICQLVCSARHAGFYSKRLARIRKMAGVIPDTTTTFVCRNCSDAPCVAACPAGALLQPGAEGLVTLAADLCTGCAICVDECPYEAVWLNEETGLAYKCDLCGGSPACLERCPTEAISLSTGEVV